MIKRNYYPLTAIAAAGLLTATFGLGHLSVSNAQDNPPSAPAAKGARPLPPGPHGERPPGPEADQPPAQAVDPKTAPAAVKTANDALAGLKAGQLWTRTAPRGEQEVQATLVFNGKDVARLDFDPATGMLRARGEGPLPPAGPRGPGAPGAPVPPPGGPVPPPADGNGPVPPPPDAAASLAPVTNAAVPPAPDANPPAPAAPVNLDPIKAKLADIVKGLSIGQGAEIMPREGFWKVPIIFQSRVVGELHVSNDGTKVMEDFAAARDAAIFAR